MPLKQAQMHLSRNGPFSDKTNLHLELPGNNEVNLDDDNDRKRDESQVLRRE